MRFRSLRSRIFLATAIIAAVVGLFAAGLSRLHFESNILESLPHDDPILADARYIIMHHPIHDKVIIDLEHPGADPDLLVEAALFVEESLRAGGLFEDVGLSQAGLLIPGLLRHTVDHLPILFNKKELEEKIKPLLTPENIRQRLEENLSSLQALEGIGQAALISADPLALKNLVMSRLASLAPSKNTRLHKGRPISADGRHTLIIAKPLNSGIDTKLAARITAALEDIDAQLRAKYVNDALTMTPVGAYRAALDNEKSAESNVKRAVLLSTVAIALLLLVGFPRPLIGLLALLPAFAGTMTAIFVYSLFHNSISLLSVGFGGAIIAFAVDYGIAYLLFLDRSHTTYGGEASQEVRSVGFIGMLTTAVSFAFLTLSGFPALMQIGAFAALGVIFTYIFVHTFFPLLFPVMPPAKRPPYVPLQRFIGKIASSGNIWKAYALLAFGIVMFIFARPEFRLDINALNAVSRETLAAEKRIQDTWGDIYGKVYLMTEGSDYNELQRKSDRLSILLDEEIEAGRLDQAFVPSMLFPGELRAGSNIAAWQAFWNPERIAGLRRDVEAVAVPLGFSPSAFDSFFKMLNHSGMPHTGLPEEFSELLGIAPHRERPFLLQVATLTPGPSYVAEDFYLRINSTNLARVFDPGLFGKRMGSLLTSTFFKMAVMVGLMTVLTAFLYFMDWKLTLIAMAPTVFALVATLGTLNLFGQPLTIPIIMVAVVVIGMGTDYALYLVRSRQRYLDDNHPSAALIRVSVFLSFCTTFIGFGVLALSDNAMLKSAGLGLALGIGYSFLGAVTLVPPILKRALAPVLFNQEAIVAGSKEHIRHTLGRYRHVEAYPRLFARFKIMLDPMFPRLADFVKNPKIIIDIGSGYGVPAVWLLTLHPQARIYGIDPDPRRVRVAALVVGARGAMQTRYAPDLPETPEKADTALMLDMVHLLTDTELMQTLQRLHEKLQPGGSLIIRATIPAGENISWGRWIEEKRIQLKKGVPHYRTQKVIFSMLTQAGFNITHSETGAGGTEECWIVAVAMDTSSGA